MINVSQAHWKSIVGRGIFSVIIGIMALVWPGVTLASLAAFFGVYALMDGILAFSNAFTPGAQRRPLIFEGTLGLAAGLGSLFWPGVTILMLMWFVATWAIATGLVEIYASWKAPHEHESNVWLGLAGAVSTLLGITMIAWPLAGAFTITLFIGAYAMAFGFLLIMYGMQARKGFDLARPFQPTT